MQKRTLATPEAAVFFFFYRVKLSDKVLIKNKTRLD